MSKVRAKSQTLLAVSVTAETPEQMRVRMTEAAAAGADLVELRLDHLPALRGEDVQMLVAGRPCPVIVTIRADYEGGRFAGEESRRLALLAEAARAGVDYIDLEFAAWRGSPDARRTVAAIRQESAGHTRVILSRHDFERTPEDLPHLFDELAAGDADIIKLATEARHVTDAFRMLAATKNAGKPAIGLCMGQAGQISRVLAGKAGAFLTFCSLEAGAEAAAGQVPIGDMLDLYGCRRVRPATAVLGVVGCPVGHSMSPALHNAAYEELGLDAVYVLLEVAPGAESFNAFIDAVLASDWLAWRGLSVTIPHKVHALRRADWAEPLAGKIGAANTLALRAGRIEAYNTDYAGAIHALCHGAALRMEELADKAVAVLGAGGVSRALVAGFQDAGCKVTVYNRTFERARELTAEFGCEAAEWEARRHLRAEIVVNGTSLGMWPQTDESPLPAEALRPDMIVFDTVYNPPVTRLLAEAAARGCRTVDGVAMFVQQAALQIQWWFNRTGALDRMRRIVLDRLRRQ